MLIKCTDIGMPNGGNTMYINPEHISLIGIAPFDHPAAGSGVVIPKGSALVWVGGRNFAVGADELEKILQAVDALDTKVVFTRPLEEALKNITQA